MFTAKVKAEGAAGKWNRRAGGFCGRRRRKKSISAPALVGQRRICPMYV